MRLSFIRHNYHEFIWKELTRWISQKQMSNHGFFAILILSRSIDRAFRVSRYTQYKKQRAKIRNVSVFEKVFIKTLTFFTIVGYYANLYTCAVKVKVYIKRKKKALNSLTAQQKRAFFRDFIVRVIVVFLMIRISLYSYKLYFFCNLLYLFITFFGWYYYEKIV